MELYLHPPTFIRGMHEYNFTVHLLCNCLSSANPFESYCGGAQGGRKVKIRETGGGGVLLWKVGSHR